MRISDTSIRNPVFAWMLMAGLIIFGGISFSRLGVSQLPDADFPVLNVSITLEGAAPEVMESTVVDPIENVLMTVEGVQSLKSSSKNGSANITVEFDLDKNIDTALQEVQTKVSQIQRILPKDMDPPTYTKSNPDDQPIIWLALTYEKDDPLFMMKFVRDYLQDRFTTIPGVGSLRIGGYTDPTLNVWIRPETLPRYNISVGDIMNAVTNEHKETPGGQIDEQKKVYNVRTMGEARSVEDFGHLVISQRGGGNVADTSNIVQLHQVANIEQGLANIRNLSRFNGKLSLGLGIQKQRGSNAVAVAKAVKAKMEEVRKDLPEGMALQVNFDSTRFIEQSVHEMNTHLILAVILTSLVCWIFLGSWSATFNVLLSIPTSIMGAFIGLYFFGFTLNTFTLLGLTLAIGIVVDDAIMVLENIFRYHEQKHGKIESAILGSREIAFAAMSASVAVIAIFLPVAFMKGVIGKFFLQFGVTISLAVFLSLIEALTITPMRSATFVHMGERTSRIGRAFEAFMETLKVRYDKSLRWTLQHRALVLSISAVFFLGSFYLVKFVNKEFTPTQDMSLFMVRLQLPVGTALKYTDQQSAKVEQWFRSRPEVKQVYAAIGGFSGGSDSNTVIMFVTMKDKGERGKDPKRGRELSQQEFMAVARPELAKIEDVKAVMMDLSSRGFSSGRGFPVEFTVQGPHWEELYEESKKIMAAMENSGTMTDIDTDYLLGMPEVQINPDRKKAAQHGISIAAIGQTVNAMIGGVRVGQFADGGHRYDIRVQLPTSISDVENVKKILVGNTRSNLIPLERVVNIDIKPSLQKISRVNRQRAITVTANLAPGASQQEAMDLVQKEAKKILKPGYFLATSGSSTAFTEAFQGLIFALILGIAVAYMVLASQFNSFLDPVAILMALPFSISGALFALAMTGQSLNIYSFIGVLLLMGIVKKNSILLVEFTNTVRDRGNDNAVSALLEACPIRLRPIIMTSFATIAAAIPSALALGAGAEAYRPMAVTIIGGVLVSTVLTLYVVPCVYAVLERFRTRDESRLKVKEAFKVVGTRNLEVD